MVVEPMKSQSAKCKIETQETGWYNLAQIQSPKNQQLWCPKSRRDRICLSFAFFCCCSIWALNELDDACIYWGFPGGSDSKESACIAGDPGSITRSGRYPGEGNGYPLQYFCLENSIDRGAWQTTVHGLAKSQTWLSN